MINNNVDFDKKPLAELLEQPLPDLDPLLNSKQQKYQSFSEILKAHDVVLDSIVDRERELDKQLDQIEEDVKIGSECDKWDYIFSASAGVLAGLVDSFLVGAPTDSKLIKDADNVMNTLVERFAKLNGWKGPKGDNDPTKSAIGYLERAFPVNYDHQHGKIVNDFMKMTPSNHHLKSLSHSPSPIGLIFSIIDQFRGTATFVDKGQLITITAESKLQGNNFVAKLFCACVNWLGHIMSDIAGSSGGKGRGSGVGIPFFEVFQLFDVGKFEHKGEQLSFAEIAVKVFEQGYDFRFGMVQTIPVLMVELLTRIFCIVRHRYEYKRSWSDCAEFLKLDKSARLRKMLLVGQGTLCLIDAGDALIRNPTFSWVDFLSRLNFVAWMRLSYLGLRHAYSILNNDVELYRYKLRAEAFEQFVDDIASITETFFSEHNKKVELYFFEQRSILENHFGELKTHIKEKDYKSATKSLNSIESHFQIESRFSDLDSFESFMMDD